MHVFEAIQDFFGKCPDKGKLVRALGQRRYLSAMRHARVMVGNTSSGIIESASFQIPVVNIGDRQGGRLRPANVIDCSCERSSLQRAIDQALSQEFHASLQGLRNPYGDGHTASRIADTLEKTDFSDGSLLRKPFFDLPGLADSISKAARPLTSR